MYVLRKYRSSLYQPVGIYGTKCYSLNCEIDTPRALSIYKGKAFMRFAKKATITDAQLWKAAQLANSGIIDADLGGGVIKQHIARAGGGKSGGSRSIILFKKNSRAVYIYGFEKKDVANIGRRELEAFRELAEVILGYTNEEIAKRVKDGALFQIEEREEDNVDETSE